MKVVLIHVTETGQYLDEDRVLLKNDRAVACNYCGQVASGDLNGVKVNKVVEVDLRNNAVEELELSLKNFKLQLVEKVRDRQA